MFLTNLLQAQIPVPEDTVNVTDSTKVVLEKVAQEIVENPHQFFSTLVEKALEFGLKVVAAIIIYAIGAWLIKKVNKVLAKMFKKKKTEKTLVSFVTSLVTISLTVILLIIVVGTLGINTTSLAALLAAGGMAIGMALSGTVQNFAGGLMILLFKPFKAGDYIKAQGYEGFVTDVTIVNTKLRTFANDIIVLPNGTLFNGTIDNFNDKPFHRESWTVDVAYGTDYDKAKKVLLDIAAADERILDSKRAEVPDPSVHFGAFKDSSVQLVLWAWVKVDDYYPVMFKISEEIYKKLPENGVQFPFPQLDVHFDQPK